MKRNISMFLILVAGIVVAGGTAAALSIALGGPEIRFPEGFDAKKAAAIEKVLHDKHCKYVDGLYSHWPPKWPTTLVYEGNAKSLKSMVLELSRIPDISVRLTFSRDLAKEAGTGHSVGDWWVMYSHDTPNTVEVRVNLSGEGIDITQLELTLSAQPPTP